MTDPMELVGRLEGAGKGPGHLKAERDGYSLLTEAAACIREMVEQIAMLEDELEVENLMAPPSISSGAGPRCNKVLAGLGKPYPRTCLVCRLGPCRDEIIHHNLPPAPGAEDE